MGNTDFLGRRPRDTRRKNDPTKPREMGRDPYAADFERGPFSDRATAPFPAGALALLERRTGKPADVALLAEWERIRAFAGYEPFEIDGRAEAMRALTDSLRSRAAAPPVAAPAPAKSGTHAGRIARVVGAALAAADGPDPEDLGD